MNTYYIICSTPRSGTNLLRHLLTYYECGIPIEVNNAYIDLKREPIEQVPTSLSTIVLDNFMKGTNFVIADEDDGTKPITIFSRIVWNYQFHRLIESLKTETEILSDIPDSEVLNALYPDIKYIYLCRRDKISQAISMEAARQSEQWLITNSDDIDKFDDYRYDFGQIAQEVLWRVDGELQWAEIFDEFKIDPLEICFEDFLQDMTETIVAITDYLGIRLAETATTDRTNHWLQQHDAPRKQTHPIKAEWAARFQSEMERVIKEVLNESANNSIIP